MFFHKRSAFPALLAATLVLGACDGDSTGSDPAKQGTLAFSYTGAVSGSFEAAGKYDRAEDFDLNGSEFGIAIVGPNPAGGTDFVSVVAFSQTGKQTGELVVLGFPYASAGTTLEFSGAACEDVNDCPGGFFIRDLDVQSQDGGPDARFFFLESGAITITEVTADRIRGTFTAHGIEDVGSETPGEIEIVSGSFDVPLIDADDVPSFSRGGAAVPLVRGAE